MINKRKKNFRNALTNEGEAMRVFHGERHRPLDERCKFNWRSTAKERVERTDSGMSTRNTLSP